METTNKSSTGLWLAKIKGQSSPVEALPSKFPARTFPQETCPSASVSATPSQDGFTLWDSKSWASACQAGSAPRLLWHVFCKVTDLDPAVERSESHRVWNANHRSSQCVSHMALLLPNSHLAHAFYKKGKD